MVHSSPRRFRISAARRRLLRATFVWVGFLSLYVTVKVAILAVDEVDLVLDVEVVLWLVVEIVLVEGLGTT